MTDEHRDELIAQGKARFIYREVNGGSWIYSMSPPEKGLEGMVTIFDRRDDAIARAITVLAESYGQGVVVTYGKREPDVRRIEMEYEV